MARFRWRRPPCRWLRRTRSTQHLCYSRVGSYSFYLILPCYYGNSFTRLSRLSLRLSLMSRLMPRPLLFQVRYTLCGLSHSFDLLSEGEPFDPLLIVCLAPSCLVRTRTVFVFLPSSGGRVSVIAVNPPSTHTGPVHVGFFLLYRSHHAWLLTPPPTLHDPSALAMWFSNLLDSGVPVVEYPLMGWASYWSSAWPSGPVPPAPPRAGQFGGGAARPSTLGGRRYGKDTPLLLLPRW